MLISKHHLTLTRVPGRIFLFLVKKFLFFSLLQLFLRFEVIRHWNFVTNDLEF